ncbi:MAG: hypothetical protein ACM30G_22425 [Micromonosporaceae bacterium]
MKLLAASVAAGLSVAVASLVITAPARADLPIAPPAFPVEGYAWGWQPNNPGYVANSGYEYNSAGGAVTITRPGTGVYQVRFAGMAAAGGVAHVSAYGSNSICVVSSWIQSGGDELVNVRCFSPAGAAADSRFIAHVTNRTDGIARGFAWSSDPTPPLGGYVPSAQYSFDSTGQQIMVFPEGVGAYAVELNAFGQDIGGLWTTGVLRVTAYGAAAVTCQALDPALFTDPAVLRVRCFDTTGHSVNSRFALSYTRGVVPNSATVSNYALVPSVVGSSGPAPSVTALDSDGDYQVTFPGAAAAGGHAFASIMGTPPMYCNIHSWVALLGSQILRVRCYQPGGGQLNPGMLVNVGFVV